MMRSQYQGGHYRRGQPAPGQGGVLDWVQDTFESVTGVEATISARLCDLIPSGIRDAMGFTQRDPFRSVLRASSHGLASYGPLLLMPFTLPLSLVQVPVLLFLETHRLLFNVVMTCGNVSGTLKTEACDLVDMLNMVSPHTTQGRILREVLRLSGQGGALDAMDGWLAKLNPVLQPLCAGDLPSPSAVISLARAGGGVTADPQFMAMVKAGEEQFEEMEPRLIAAASELGYLDANAEAVTSAGDASLSAIAAGDPPPRPSARPSRRKVASREGIRARQAEVDAAAAAEGVDPAVWTRMQIVGCADPVCRAEIEKAMGIQADEELAHEAELVEVQAATGTTRAEASAILRQAKKDEKQAQTVKVAATAGIGLAGALAIFSALRK